MTTTIRRLQPGEGAIFRDIRLAALTLDETSFASTLAEEQAKTLVSFETRVTEDGVFVAEVDGKVLGVTGLCRKTAAKEAHKGFVYSMFVLPEGRRQGLGSALLQAVLDYARGEVESVQLAVVSTNSGAVALYEGAGFERYGFEPRALKFNGVYTDDLLMWKRLK